ncbi:MAG: hypothetical protein KGI04_01120 [Candidatus Micrarchaeota archaeon]|nr:hypothetical protein [Candidatus Micrarchaeota archaeon]
MKKDVLVARNVDKEAYARFRRKALERGLNVGAALTSAMELWMEKGSKKKKDIRNLMALEGFIKMGRKGNWSEHVDDILYGSYNDIPRH